MFPYEGTYVCRCTGARVLVWYKEQNLYRICGTYYLQTILACALFGPCDFETARST